MTILISKHRDQRIKDLIRCRNVLVIMTDDIGLDRFQKYHDVISDLSGSVYNTPVHDIFAESGLLFKRAYTAPICSPTRAMIQTGKHTEHSDNGVGSATDITNGLFTMPTASLTIAKALKNHPNPIDTGWFGKNHLGTSIAHTVIDLPKSGFGYDHFEGKRANVQPYQQDNGEEDYDENPPTTDGYLWYDNVSESKKTGKYLDQRITDQAVAWINARVNPWFCYVPYQLGHAPFHTPPSSLWTGAAPTNDAERYEKMVESVDTLIGELLAVVDYSNTCIILLGDNGTPNAFLGAPWDSRSGGKGTFWESGIRIPFMIRHPMINSAEVCTKPICTQDIFPTVLDLFDTSKEWDSDYPLSGKSLIPYIISPDAPKLNRIITIANYNPGGVFSSSLLQTYTHCGFAGNNDQYKVVIDRLDDSETMYDVEADFNEASPLNISSLTTIEQAAYDAITTELDVRKTGYIMGQYVYPINDIAEAGAWFRTSDGGDNLIAVDATNKGFSQVDTFGAPWSYLVSPLNPRTTSVNHRMYFNGTSVTLPSDKTRWMIQLLVRKFVPAGNGYAQLDCTMRLFEGGTQRALATKTDITTEWTYYSYTLSVAEATAITVGTGLRLDVRGEKITADSSNDCRLLVGYIILVMPKP